MLLELELEEVVDGVEEVVPVLDVLSGGTQGVKMLEIVFPILPRTSLLLPLEPVLVLLLLF